MSLDKLFSLILEVITNKYIIIVFVGICFYIQFVSYVCNYRKQPKTKKKKKTVTKSAETTNQKKSDENSNEDSKDDGEAVEEN